MMGYYGRVGDSTQETYLNPLPPFKPEFISIGQKITRAIFYWNQWIFRKVETLELLPGTRSQRRVSLDLYPRAIPVVELHKADDTSLPLNLVPLTFMGKDVLKNFSLQDESGNSIALLGRDGNGVLSACALAYFLDEYASPKLSMEQIEFYWPELLDITLGDPEVAEIISSRFISFLKSSEAVTRYFREFSQCFLLIACFPDSLLNRRQIIKYSYHQGFDYQPLFWDSIKASFGIGDYPIFVTSGAKYAAASYHFECILPEEIIATEISFPPDRHREWIGSEESTGVPHINAKYDISDAERDDYGYFAVAPRFNSLLGKVMLCAFGSVIIFMLFAMFPEYTINQLSTAPGAASALLLAIPAVIAGLLARQPESYFVSKVLFPTRILVATLAVLLFVTSALIEISGAPPTSNEVLITILTFRDCWIRIGLFLAVAIFLVTACGTVRVWRKERFSDDKNVLDKED